MSETLPTLPDQQLPPDPGPTSEGVVQPAYDLPEYMGINARDTDAGENLEVTGKHRLRRIGSAVLKYSAYTVQALRMGKEQVKSYGLGATVSTLAHVSKASEKLAPKLDDLAYRRGAENKWRSASGTVLRSASRGLTRVAPSAKSQAYRVLDKYEDSYIASERTFGGGAITRAAQRYTNRIEGNRNRKPRYISRYEDPRYRKRDILNKQFVPKDLLPTIKPDHSKRR